MSAEPPTIDTKKPRTGKFLTFKLSTETYAVEVLKIKEIIRMQRIKPVPHLPAYMKGIINLRGKVIPVVDLRMKVGLDTNEETERTCVIVAQVHLNDESPVAPVGMIVDAVEEVLNISEEHVVNNPNIGSNFDNRFIQGLAKINDSIVTLLEIDRLFSEDDALTMQA
jgi:purine-binding chemotaxis protein CheW|tara:strand:+ start:4656 stop:5156 length:501 start_codon:yes stop_codon:yes gene_type:complete